MIVLDEQLMGRSLETSIARWYPGAVCFITDLRPDTVIKDESIPMLLQREADPTFVTINETDFWHKVEITDRFSVICFALPDSRAHEISGLLQRLLRHSEFQTKASRMGKVARVTATSVFYYTSDNTIVSLVEGW